jgi:hypothetical protein
MSSATTVWSQFDKLDRALGLIQPTPFAIPPCGSAAGLKDFLSHERKAADPENSQDPDYRHVHPGSYLERGNETEQDKLR